MRIVKVQRAFTLGLLVLLSLAGRPVRANPADVFGFGSRGTAMGGAMSTMAHDYTALYYNPAAITLSKRTVGGGLLFSFDTAHIDLYKKAPQFDIPREWKSYLGPGHLPTAELVNRRSSSSDIEDVGGFIVGATHNLGVENLRFGLALYMPLNKITMQRTYFNDEREALFSNQLHFNLLGDRSQRQVLLLGIAYRIVPVIAIGIGASVLTETITDTETFTGNPTQPENVILDMDTVTKTVLAPTVGVLVIPTNYLRVGISFREQIGFRVHGSYVLQVQNLEESTRDRGVDYPMKQDLDMLVQFTPRQLVLGLAFLPADGVSLSADLTWINWAEYRDEHNQPPQPAFQDTYSERFGVEWAILSWLRWRAGAFWDPSPVPDQEGRTNFVDNDRLGLSTGTGFNWDFQTMALEVDWHVQGQLLMARSVAKDSQAPNPVLDEAPGALRDFSTGQPLNDPAAFETNNPGFPGFASWGSLWSFGLSTTLTF